VQVKDQGVTVVTVPELDDPAATGTLVLNIVSFDGWKDPERFLELFIDGKSVGSSDFDGTLPGQKYVFEAEAPGYVTTTRDLEVLTAGPFPYNPRWRHSALEGAAQRALDLVARLNWRLAGGRDS
jgi:hypothetical protein